MSTQLRSIEAMPDLEGKVVLLRADYNVHFHNKKIVDTERIVRTFDTIDYLRAKGAAIVIISHLGRPKGKKVMSLSLKPVAEVLRERYETVRFIPDCQGAKVQEAVKKLKPGEIALLENVRFYDYETVNDELFAKHLAMLGDYYVNDAFGVSHRKHASVHAVTAFLDSYAGFNLITEVANIEKVMRNFKKPACAIIGGVKISTKIKVIERFCKKFDYVLIGGALANNFFVNKKIDVGMSFYEKNYLPLSQSLLNKYGKKIILPTDIVVSSSLKKSTDHKVMSVDDMDSTNGNSYIVDIGPETIANFKRYIAKSATLVWNGPLGLFEVPEFAQGTNAIAKEFAAHVKAQPYGLVGGGETIAVVNTLKLGKKIDFISTGGGAMLEYIEKGTLPGLEKLIR